MPFGEIFKFATYAAVAVKAAQEAKNAIDRLYNYNSKKVTKKKSTKKKK